MSLQTSLLLPSGAVGKADALLNHLYGDGTPAKGNFRKFAEREMRTALVEDSQSLPSQVGAWPESWKYVEINSRRIKNAPSIPYSMIARMRFGSKANFFAEGAPARDLIRVVYDIYKIIVKLSPIRPSSMFGYHPRGLYARSHRIFVNERPIGALSSSDQLPDNSYARIVNQLDYASVIEAPKNHRVYQRALTIAKRKYGRDWDLAVTFASPEGFGGNIYAGRYRGFPPPYAIPVFTVARLNSLPRTGFIYKRRRTKNQRGRRFDRR